MLPGMATPMLLGNSFKYPSTWNPADLGQVTLSDGNRTMSPSAATYGNVRGVLSLSGALLKFSAKIGVTVAQAPLLGVANAGAPIDGSSYIGIDPNGISYQCGTGAILRNNSVLATYASSAVGDVITIDIASGNFAVSKNGTLLGTITSHLISGTIYPAASGVFGSPSPTLRLL